MLFLPAVWVPSSAKTLNLRADQVEIEILHAPGRETTVSERWQQQKVRESEFIQIKFVRVCVCEWMCDCLCVCECVSLSENVCLCMQERKWMCVCQRKRSRVCVKQREITDPDRVWIPIFSVWRQCLCFEASLSPSLWCTVWVCVCILVTKQESTRKCLGVGLPAPVTAITPANKPALLVSL